VILHHSHKLPAYADRKCGRCEKPKDEFGNCRECPFSLRRKFADLKAEFDIEVTPVMVRFAHRILELDAELTAFGGSEVPLTRLEKDAILMLRSERTLFEKSLLPNHE